MKEKFTKGSWVSDVRVGCCAVYPENSRDEWEQGLHDDERNIFYASYKNMAIDPSYSRQAEEAIANAHLIACAPDMYAEIKRDIECLTKWINSHGDAFPMTAAWKDMRANKIELLKRARGE